MVLANKIVIYNNALNVNINKDILFVTNVKEIEFLINMEQIVYVLKGIIVLIFFKKIVAKKLKWLCILISVNLIILINKFNLQN